MFDDQQDEQDNLPSKSELKRQMLALQEIGKKLLEMTPAQIKTLQLDDELLEALAEYKRIKSHEARRRHLQRIGKLMRNRDHVAIQAGMERYDSSSETHARHFSQLEHWRDRLVEDDAALAEFMAEWPACEAQKIRQLIRNTRQERVAEKPPNNARKLFRYLRDICEAVPK